MNNLVFLEIVSNDFQVIIDQFDELFGSCAGDRNRGLFSDKLNDLLLILK